MNQFVRNHRAEVEAFLEAAARSRDAHVAGNGDLAAATQAERAALLLLAENPRNGYQLMQEIESRSNGMWRPSAGSIYPALAQLEDEGLVRGEEQDGSRTFVLTDAGRVHVDERRAELGAQPVSVTASAARALTPGTPATSYVL